jgi:ribosomal protein S18 acetylase RimI-like enzyme
MSVSFERAETSDLPTLMRFMQDFHEFDHTTPFDNAPARIAMETVVANESVGRVWLIRYQGENIGYIVLTLHYRLESRGISASMDELFIREENRGMGIGRQAMNFLKNTCRELGVATIQLEVKSDNPEAAALYEKAGFEKLDRAFMLATL